MLVKNIIEKVNDPELQFELILPSFNPFCTHIEGPTTVLCLTKNALRNYSDYTITEINVSYINNKKILVLKIK